MKRVSSAMLSGVTLCGWIENHPRFGGNDTSVFRVEGFPVLSTRLRGKPIQDLDIRILENLKSHTRQIFHTSKTRTVFIK
jgi:hypothetical protein